MMDSKRKACIAYTIKRVLDRLTRAHEGQQAANSHCVNNKVDRLTRAHDGQQERLVHVHAEARNLACNDGETRTHTACECIISLAHS